MLGEFRHVAERAVDKVQESAKTIQKGICHNARTSTGMFRAEVGLVWPQ